MNSLARRVSLALVTMVATGVLAAAPAHAQTFGDFEADIAGSEAKITSWHPDTDACPTSLAVPASLDGKAVTAIGNYAFQSHACMASAGATKSVTLPASVTSVGDGAFKSNPGLSLLTVNGDIPTLPAKAFYNDTSLATVVFLGSGPTYAADTFAGLPGTALVYYKSGTTLHGGGAWPATYAGLKTYVLPEFGVAGVRAGQVSRKSKAVYFYPTVGANAEGTAYLVVYAKVKSKGHTHSKLMCRSDVDLNPTTKPVANMQCSSTAARRLVRKHRTTFYAKFSFVQSGSGYTTSVITKTITLKRK